MSYEKVLQAKKFIIGTKQAVKALHEGTVLELIVAVDADRKVTAQVINEAKERNVPIHYADSMKKLGKACRIQVGAAAVAIIR
ncbi:50S ribosomal protein L7ae-like protein [Neobacillus mesonae]|uniref:50S ribosomal protein L7ae-like protein n=1 Tax=Neobacillus mesonae TaxID=1193713 RepID=A0A3Q9QQM2_9BACI|nr:50S ribosomal protein L7ae-like protein [Neobacillus mesonae]AZU59904.1 50S ribosomal protein L7ae-like protein [Neobacillus mesonae]MED4207054.1 50S ribosomal protein L7ae-like protein [Neobacillus mesonae]